MNKNISPYIAIRQTQKNNWQVYFRGTTNPIMQNYRTPLHCFTSRKKANQYLKQNWHIIDKYNL